MILKQRGIVNLSDGKMRRRTVAIKQEHDRIIKEVFTNLGKVTVPYECSPKIEARQRG